ncbi:MAG: sialidase family protein [Saprospiraceae bacterium]|nr:sialidase family protein [Saprospiraceae bacterium]
MKISSLLTFFFMIALLADVSAQKVDVEKLKGISIRNVGPSGMSGRITAIGVDPRNSDIIYVGAASGGVWKSMNGGITWTPTFDKEAVQGIGAIAVDPINPDVIWAGTGEGNPRNSHNSGKGIYKSLDGGKTWKLMGLEKTFTIHRVIVSPHNSDVVYAATMGSIWGPNEDRGVFKTTDGGKTWNKILYVNDATGAADMVLDPSNSNKLLVAMWEYDRDPWQFKSGGKGSGLYVTLDGGETWTKRTNKDGLPDGDLGRIGLAIAANKPNIIYALVEAKENFLYKSTDGGATWSKANQRANEGNISNRPFYYHELYVDPQNENRIYNLYSNVSKSEDGGKTFSVIANSAHSDHHAFWIDPKNPNLLMLGTDGGFYISRDGGDNWRFIDNLPVGQFYHVNYDMSIPYQIGGGMQDNGSWVGPASEWKRGGILNTDWQEVYFGDGFDLGFRPNNPRYVYAMSQGGNVGYVDTETGKSTPIRPTHPDPKVELRFNWNAAFAQNPFQECGIYYGSQFVHKSMDCGQSWEIISPDLTTNDTLKQRQSRETGGLTPDVTAAENHTTILAIVPSPVDQNVLWVGTDDGNIQMTRDGGKTWTNLLSKLPGVKAGSWIPYIEASTKNAGEAFVVVNDYRRNDWRPMVFHTNNYGQTFTRIVDEKQVSGYALCIVQDPVEPKLLWLGTDHGLWFSIDMGANWNKWTNGFPSVQVADLKIHPREHDLIVGTFGRSFWVLDDLRPFRELVQTKGAMFDQPLAIFDAPDAYFAEYRSYDGYHFPGEAIYQGENKSANASIALWIGKQPERKGGERPAAPETSAGPGGGGGFGGGGFGGGFGGGGRRGAHRVKVAVFDMDGNAVRNYTAQLDSGMTRLFWDMRYDGVRFPSRQEPRPDADTPAGAQVLPSKYKIVVSLGDQKDSTFITVNADPRVEIPMEDRKAKIVAVKEFSKVVETAAKAYDQIREAQKTIKTVNDAMANADAKVKKEIADMGKKVQDKLAELEKLFFAPENQKGIVRSSDNLQSTIQRAASALNAGDGAPTQAAKRGMEFAKSELSSILTKMNEFFSKDFAEYKQKVEATEYSVFKAYEPMKLN